MDDLLIFGTIRAASLCYMLALAAWMLGRRGAVRVLWVGGVVLYLAHIAAAFSIRYAWSHDAAYAETARQTEALFGFRSGSGVYWNYAFTLLWTADACWMMLAPASYWTRARWISRAVDGFMAFMFVNAAIVFPTGWMRWAGVAAAGALTVLWRRRVNAARRASSAR